MPMPPAKEDKLLTWPNWPLKFRTSSSQEEGAEREFSIVTTRFTGRNGNVKQLHCARADEHFKPLPGSEFELKADLVLLAMGFLSPVHEGMIKELGLEVDQRGNVKATTEDGPSKPAYQTSNLKVFSAGDMRRGQSLIVWAIREGRQAAHAVDKYLMGETTLPR
jgi:glutamate synthase (NADPH/NADH) small chain